MSTVSKITDFQTTQFTSEEVPVQALFEKQRAYFATVVTKTYEWRIDQLDRLIHMLKNDYERFSDASRKDFKTAAQENVFEVSASIATAEYTKTILISPPDVAIDHLFPRYTREKVQSLNQWFEY